MTYHAHETAKTAAVSTADSTAELGLDQELHHGHEDRDEHGDDGERDGDMDQDGPAPKDSGGSGTDGNGATEEDKEGDVQNEHA